MDKIQANIYCPKCGYIITVQEKMYVMYDYTCPRCHKKKIGEFKTITEIIKENV